MLDPLELIARKSPCGQPALSSCSLGSFYNLITAFGRLSFCSSRRIAYRAAPVPRRLLGPRSVGCEGLALSEPGVMASSVAATLSLYPVNYANGCAQHNFP